VASGKVARWQGGEVASEGAAVLPSVDGSRGLSVSLRAVSLRSLARSLARSQLATLLLACQCHTNTCDDCDIARLVCSFESSGTDAAANQGPPTLVWRVFAALCYLVPWIDSISFGREIYRRFRNLLVLYLVPGPLAKVYFSSQFAPLIIFFVLFLAVVKNKKLHHFVRFNCMQAIMLDIVIMLCHIVKAYLPAEIKWSVIAHLVDMGMWTTCMGTVVYAVFWTLRGYYADIPFVSESVYHQVALSEYA
jgi:uncharacterized membrane protein